MSTTVHPRLAPRRGARVASWWGRAWQRAVEEAAVDEGLLRRARALARSGTVGAVGVGPGRVAAAVPVGRDPDDTVTVQVACRSSRPTTAGCCVELVAAASGRVGDLLAGDLPLALVEEAEEAGVELLPDGGQLDATCGCDAWADPCVHALALLVQVGWLLDADPFVLLALRGLDREALLAGLGSRRGGPHVGGGGADGGDGADGSGTDDELAVALDLGEEAALRAAALLADLGEGDG